MPAESRSNFHARHRGVIAFVTGKHILLLLGLFGWLIIDGTGCMTRSGAPTYGIDSTLVYPSRLANDVNASITFQLKDSALRDAERKRDKERAREISRVKRDRSKLLATIEKEANRLEKAEAKRKAQEARKAGKAKGKKGKKSSSVAETRPSTPASSRPVLPKRPDPALRDSLAVIEARLAALSAEDSVASLAPWKIKREDGRPADERIVDLEEGARVQASIRLENVYARGKRPLMFHFVWLNPERKRVFKRMVEYTPNDSTQTLSSSLTISPAKRSSGTYAVQVFLFREEIAEKTITFRGTGVEEQEKGGGESM